MRRRIIKLTETDERIHALEQEILDDLFAAYNRRHDRAPNCGTYDEKLGRLQHMRILRATSDDGEGDW